MKLMIKKLSLFAFIGLLFLAIAGCTTTTTTVSELTDTEKVAAVLDGIDLGNISAVTADMTLPTTVDGVSLSWSSANTNVLSNTGAVVIPAYTVGNVTVVLTVTATLNDVTDSKTFNVTVSKETVTAFLTRAGNSIIINSADSITSNFTLPATVLGADVTWVSSNTAMVSIAETAVDDKYAVTVTRPSIDDGGANTSAQLTATLSIDDNELEVVKTILVLAEAGSTHVTTIAEGLALQLGTYITWEGMTILGKGTDGFYFTDGTDIMFVYSSSISPTVTVGAVYDVTGGIALYNSIPEVQTIGSNVVKVKTSTVAAREVTPTVATIDEIIANHVGYDGTNPMVFKEYTVTAKVYYDEALGSYGTYLVLNDALTLDKTHAIRIYYKSNMTTVSALAGQTVTLNIVMFGYNSGANYLDWYAYFFGTTDDIQVTFANDQDAVDAAFNSLTIPLSVLEDTTLDLPASLFGVSLSYASSDAAVINPTTGFVDRASVTGQVSVTLTVTATRDSVTDSTDYVIKVGETPLSTIAQVYSTDIAVYEAIRIQGILTGKTAPTAFWIQDATGGLDIYAATTDVQNQLIALLGQKVELIGKKELYNGLYEITTITSVTVVDASPTAVVPASLNEVAFTKEALLPYQGTLVSFEGFILTANPVVDSYGNVTFTLLDLATGRTIPVKWDSRVGDVTALTAALTAFHAGDAVNIVGAVVAWPSNNPLIGIFNATQVVAGTAVTDADYLANDALLYTTNLELTSDYVLPTPVYSTFAVSAISSELTAYIADGTTQLTVTNPEGADVSGTVTITLTKGTTTLDVVLNVTVKAVTDAEKLAAAQADLTVATTANEYDTLVLPTEGLMGTSIAWALNTGDAVLTDSKLFFNLTGSAYDVTLTATLTLGTETALTKDFTVAVSPITVISDLSLLTAKSGDPLAWTIANTTNVYVQGVVTGVVYDGVFIQDASGNGFFLYHPVGTVAVGDEIVAKGALADFRSARQLAYGGVVKVILTSENSVDSQVLTLDEVIALTYADCGSVFTVTGLEVYSYPNSTTVIFKVNGTSSVQYLRLYYNDWASWLDEVYPVGTFLPEVQFNMYNIYTTNVANPGDTFNIDNFLISVTDEQLLTVALASVVLPTAITADTTLTFPASYAGVALTYTSDNDAVINAATGVVDLSSLTTQVTVTITVTATYGESGTDTATFAIKVGTIPLSTVAEVIAAATSTVVRVHGVVTMSEYYHTYMIQDATGGVAVYTGDATILAFLASNYGKEIEVIGSRTAYSGLVEIAPTEATLVGDGVLPTPANLDAVTLDATNLLAYQGQLAEVTNMLVTDVYADSYGNITLTLTRVSDGTYVKMKWDSRVTLSTEANALISGVVLGDIVNVQTVLGWASSNPMLFFNDKTVITEGTLTDQQIADYELTKVTLPATPQTADFTLDVAGVVGSTIEWASNDAAIAITGSAAVVTRPDSSSSDVVVTLTYTVTYGTATASSTIDITVTAESSAPVETVAYSTGFEAADSFAATTVYNNTSVLFSGAASYQWGTYYGTPSTTSPITDLQSMQMRYYTTAPANYGYTYTNFSVADVTKVVFTAKNYAGTVDVTVSYSTDGGANWTVAQVIDLTTTATEYSVTINSTGNTMIKFEMSGTTVADRLTIDTVSIFNMQ